MNRRCHVVLLVLIFLVSSQEGRLFAQTRAVEWFTVDGGGGKSTGSRFEIEGTIGQPDAGLHFSTGSRWAMGGFWACKTVGTTVALYEAGFGTPPAPTSMAGGYWILDGGSVVTGGPVANDLGHSAWNVTDASETLGEFLLYTVTPSAAQFAAAATRGWRLDARVRMVNDFGDSPAQIVMFDDGRKRWSMLLDLDEDSDLTVVLQAPGNSPLTLTTGGSGTNAYHDLALVHDPATGLASFYFDGQLMTDNYRGLGSAIFSEVVAFGAASSAGRGSVNYHCVSMTIPDLYDPLLDNDGDGLVNWFERFFATDPQIPNGKPFTALGSPAAGSFTFSYPVAPGFGVDLIVFEWSPDLINWFPGAVDTGVVGSGPGGTTTYETTVTGFPRGTPRAFVRMARAR